MAGKSKDSVFSYKASGQSWDSFSKGKTVVSHPGSNAGRRPGNRELSRNISITKHFTDGTVPPKLKGPQRGGNDRTNIVQVQMAKEVNTKARQKQAQANLKIAKAQYGFTMSAVPPNAGKDVFNKISNPTLYGRRDSGGHSIPNVELGLANKKLQSGLISINEYQNLVGGINKQKKENEMLASQARSKAYQVESRNQISKDSAYWNSVASDFSSKKAKTDTALAIQAQANYDNLSQKEYTKALRAGEVNLATALLNQRTAGGYKGKNTVNIENFLTERGYDITQPQTIPDSIFKPEKQLGARKQTKAKNMGDLRKKANVYSKINVGPNNFFNSTKFKANAPLEFMGPTNQKRIENFKFLDDRPITLTGFVTNQYGKDMTTGEIKRLKTVGETTSPEMQFFGQFIQGSRNTFDSYGNMITNTGNFLQGKEQQPLARPPIQDQFFGAVIDSAKNTFEGKSENRASDPMSDFLNVQQKRIDKNGFGQVAGELTTEALFWALPVSPALKGIKVAKGFFSPTVKTIKASDNFTPGKDFLKYEGKTKDVSLSDYLGSFFNKGGKYTQAKPAPFFATGATLGKATGKTTGKKKGGNNFFSGSSGSGKTSGGKFFDDLPKSTKTNTGLELILKNAPKTKVKPKPKTIQFEQFLKLNSKYEQKIIAKELAKQTKPKPSQFFKQLPKQKQNQFLKQTPKQKQLLKTKQLVKQNFFKPIPILKVNQKQQQKQKQFFKEPTKQSLKITPKLTPKQKEKQKSTTALVTPFFPQTAKTGGAFFPLPPFFNSGGRRGLGRTRKRRGQKAYTAWNVNTKQVGSFLKGPTYKKSRSDYIFKDLDKRTKKAKKEKGYDYLDFF